MQHLVEQLSNLLRGRNMKLVTAESCTGGLLAATITHRAGASDVFERGFVTYSNEAKIDELGVSEEIIASHGAVSAETATAMAEGALKNSRANLAVSITGIAGPGGGSDEKPVGLVYFGYALKGGSAGHIKKIFEDENQREKIQVQACITALKNLISILEDQ